MKLFKYTLGIYENYGVFEDADEAYAKRGTIDHIYDFTPVDISEVAVPGYRIILEPTADEGEHDEDEAPTLESETKYLEGAGRDALKEWLAYYQIPYVPQLGEEKLRELALNNVELALKPKEGVV